MKADGFPGHSPFSHAPSDERAGVHSEFVRLKVDDERRRNGAEEGGAGKGVAVKQRETSGAPHPPAPLRISVCSMVGVGAQASFRSGPQPRTQEGSPLW